MLSISLRNSSRLVGKDSSVIEVAAFRILLGDFKFEDARDCIDGAGFDLEASGFNDLSSSLSQPTRSKAAQIKYSFKTPILMGVQVLNRARDTYSRNRECQNYFFVQCKHLAAFLSV
jgi:hypothetical protein